jgi:DmsE family decaheme c-type cytochrome
MKGALVRTTARACFLGLVLILVLPARGQGQEDRRLKPGAKGQICLECHDAFQEKLARPFLHTPLKNRECSSCHNPHAASHGNLLAARPEQVCQRCHQDVAPETARSVHQPARDGQCMTCHDPHSSNDRFNLVKPASALCFDCHKDLAARVASAKFPHKPLQDGCATCHDPHASSGAARLLKREAPGLCLSCHSAATASFSRSHMGYPVAQSRCTDCHDAHGSSQKAMLFDNVHSPVAKRMCRQCHEEPTAANPLSIKKDALELCGTCHAATVADAFAKKSLHWPLADRKSCLSCHNPHAARQKPLIEGSMLETCGKCHSDTMRRQQSSLVKHVPATSGDCAACHEVHGSDNAFYLKGASNIELCGSCHNYQHHSSHPIGEKVIDPRNGNLTLDCLSCHRSHGSEYQYLAPYDHTKALCLQCHEQMAR